MMQEVYITISVLIVIVNSIELALLVKVIKTLKPCEQYLLSLSIADLLVGVSTLCAAVVHGEKFETKQISATTVENDLVWMGVWFSALASIFHITGMTHDRLYAVRKPLKHKLRMTKKFMTKIIVAIWLVCLAFTLPCAVMRKSQILRAMFTFQIPGTAGLLIITYSYIIYKSTHYSRNQINLASTPLSSSSTVRQRRKEKNLILMCLMIAFSFFAFNMPFYIQETLNQAPKYTLLLLVSNSLANPLVYFFWKYMERRARSLGNEQQSTRNTQPKTNNTMTQQ
eukprot:gene10790-11944_t